MTDKTGTLTKRKFEVKLCSIHGKLFNLQMNNDTNIYKMGEDDIKDSEIIKETKSNSKFASIFSEFIISLSICHSIKAIHQMRIPNYYLATLICHLKEAKVIIFQ